VLVQNTAVLQHVEALFAKFISTPISEVNRLQAMVPSKASSIEIITNDWDGDYPWNLKKAPIALHMKAKRLPEWQLVNGAPKFPDKKTLANSTSDVTEKITLVPYGCTTLRITEFPVVR